MGSYLLSRVLPCTEKAQLGILASDKGAALRDCLTSVLTLCRIMCLTPGDLLHTDLFF
jgi:hypothetical protein